MDKVRTVSDTKRDFYSHHTRPISSVYRQVVEELMVEMHLLSVNSDFRVDPIYCLGVVTAFERFMQGYRPEEDIDSIYKALCQSVGSNADEYRSSASQALSLAQRMSSLDELLAWLKSPSPQPEEESLAQAVEAIANNPHFKYSRLFAIGLYTMLEKIDPQVVTEESNRNQTLDQLSEVVNLPQEKIKKDLELYRGNLEKMDQVIKVLDEALQADRKKREQKLLEKNNE